MSGIKRRKLLPLRSSNYFKDISNSSIVESNKTGDYDSFVQKEFPLRMPPSQKLDEDLRKKSTGTRTESRSSTLRLTGRKNYDTQIGPLQQSSIVCTFMHRKEIVDVYAAIDALGKYKVDKNVSSQTSHVVCGEAKRTINLMRGIALGCWILHTDWITQSLQAGYWIPEEPFEVMEFPAVQQCRVHRETFGSRGSICNVFENGDIYYVARKTSPPCNELINLLKMCGARVVNNAARANVVVTSEAVNHLPSVVQVVERWVLDSISENMLQEKRKYSPFNKFCTIGSSP